MAEKSHLASTMARASRCLPQEQILFTAATYAVLAPEHPLTLKITTDSQKKAVEEYIENAGKVSEIDRLSTTREMTGVFTGAYATNPINGRRIPIYVADYVLATYGTGAVMGCSGSRRA